MAFTFEEIMVFEGKEFVYFLLNDCGIGSVDTLDVLFLGSFEQS